MVTLLLAIAVVWQAQAAPLVQAATCTQPQQRSLPFDNTSGVFLTASATPRCFLFTVPDGTRKLQVDLIRQNANGEFNLFLAAGRVSTLTILDQQEVFAGGNRTATFVVPTLNEEQYTVAVVAAAGSPRFKLRVRAFDDAAPGAPSEQSNGELELLASAFSVSTDPLNPLTLLKLTQSLFIAEEPGSEVTYPFFVAAPGEVTLLAFYEDTAGELELRLEGPPRQELDDPTTPYATTAGAEVLSLSYTVSPEDLNRGGQWQVRVVNISGGSVSGQVDIRMAREMFVQTLRPDNPITAQDLRDYASSLAYVVAVPPDTAALTLQMTGRDRAGTAGVDFDVYVRHDLPAFDGAADWAGTSSDASETIRISDPAPGLYFIRVQRASGDGSFDLAATLQERDPSTVTPVPSALSPGSLAQVDPVRADDGLNLRTGAGVGYPAFHSIPPGETVVVLNGRVQVDGSPWVRVRHATAGREGWVNGNFLLTPSGAPSPVALYDGAPGDGATFCDGGFRSDCTFAGCAVGRRLLWGPFCRADDHPNILPGYYQVTVEGSGAVTGGATDWGLTGEHFSLGGEELSLPATYEFCWPGREPNGYGFETVVTSLDESAYISGVKVDYLGGSCEVNSLPPSPTGLVTEIVQTGPLTLDEEISGSLVFEVLAYDATEGPMDGDGIAGVAFAIYDADGELVYRKNELQRGYCAFGGGVPDCAIWTFDQDNPRWPSGRRLTPGSHLLYAAVFTEDGRRQDVEQEVEITAE
jgi:hypothetical protein